MALAYNVAVLFSTMPLVNEIQVTVTEQGEPMDEGYYVFTRDDVQSAYGVMLSREMVNESGWRQIKDDHLRPQVCGALGREGRARVAIGSQLNK